MLRPQKIRAAQMKGREARGFYPRPWVPADQTTLPLTLGTQPRALTLWA